MSMLSRYSISDTINQVQEISRGECTVFLDEITGGKCNGNGVGGTPDNANSFP